jgi:hypothetical protein
MVLSENVAPQILRTDERVFRFVELASIRARWRGIFCPPAQDEVRHKEDAAVSESACSSKGSPSRASQSSRTSSFPFCLCLTGFSGKPFSASISWRFLSL